MIAEDDVIIRMGIADFLRDRGFNVLEAASLAEAQALFMSQAPIEGVFSDINMSTRNDGIELARWLEAHYPDVPVILTSGVAEAYAAPASSCQNVRQIITKPYDFGEIELKLRAFRAASANPWRKV